jgi:hypothetical protein
MMETVCLGIKEYRAKDRGEMQQETSIRAVWSVLASILIFPRRHIRYAAIKLIEIIYKLFSGSKWVYDKITFSIMSNYRRVKMSRTGPSDDVEFSTVSYQTCEAVWWSVKLGRVLYQMYNTICQSKKLARVSYQIYRTILWFAELLRVSYRIRGTIWWLSELLIVLHWIYRTI